MKLLAKTAEERYQTAAGVERDLRRCLADSARGSLAGFPLGEEDAPDRLLIPEKLYGREREIDTILASFDRIAPARIAVLELLAGQAAISLENTRLYGDLREREAKIRRLVDSNIIGIFIARPDGQILEANQAFLRIVGCGDPELDHERR